MKKKRGIALLITALMFVLCVTGCGTQKIETTKKETTEEKKLQIGLSFDSFVIERWLRDRDMFVSTAQGLGAEVNVQVAGGDVDEQISQIEYFIQKEMDVIVIIPIDGDALYDVVKEAKDKGIKVVCYDRMIANVDADLYITIDNEMKHRRSRRVCAFLSCCAARRSSSICSSVAGSCSVSACSVCTWSKRLPL